MAEYKNEEPCEFIYSITAIEKVVDGDTIDAVFDLGFDVRICNRIRLLGIDTPECDKMKNPLTYTLRRLAHLNKKKPRKKKQ